MRKIIIFSMIFTFVFGVDFKIMDINEDFVVIGKHKYGILQGCKNLKIGDSVMFKEQNTDFHCLQKNVFKVGEENDTCLLLCDI